LRGGHGRIAGAVLWLALPLVLAAVAASVGLIAHSALAHDLSSGLFAVLLASLSGRASIAWCESRREMEEQGRTPTPQEHR